MMWPAETGSQERKIFLQNFLMSPQEILFDLYFHHIQWSYPLSASFILEKCLEWGSWGAVADQCLSCQGLVRPTVTDDAYRSTAACQVSHLLPSRVIFLPPLSSFPFLPPSLPPSLPFSCAGNDETHTFSYIQAKCSTTKLYSWLH